MRISLSGGSRSVVRSPKTYSSKSLLIEAVEAKRAGALAFRPDVPDARAWRQQWFWNTNDSQNGAELAFEDPAGLTGNPCTDWGHAISDCGIGVPYPDTCLGIGGTRSTETPPGDVIGDTERQVSTIGRRARVAVNSVGDRLVVWVEGDQTENLGDFPAGQCSRAQQRDRAGRLSNVRFFNRCRICLPFKR